MNIIKRDGSEVEFRKEKITSAVSKAFDATSEVQKKDIPVQAEITTSIVMSKLRKKTPDVETVQDLVEDALTDLRFKKTAKAYILYRAEHAKERTRKESLYDSLSGKFDEITHKTGETSSVTKGSSGNANVDSDGPMGKMLQYGAETSKTLALEKLVEPRFSKAHNDGDIHIHDLDFLPTKTLTCCQIDLEKLFKGGFSTGHGYLREPMGIQSYTALAAIVLQANQNEQHGGQAIPCFDFYMAPGVAKTFCKEYKKLLADALEDVGCKGYAEKADAILSDLGEPSYGGGDGYDRSIADILMKDTEIDNKKEAAATSAKIRKRAVRNTDKATFQAMEGLVHNLNTMHSRAGAQIPFTSINYGTDTSPEGRLVMKQLLLATESGLGNGETPIFPIQIFKLKEGVSYNEEDPNYDLFELACKVSAKRLFPNFSFLDSPFNAQYYKEGHPESEATYMGCRTRVIGNVCGEETVTGRGNLSFTSINLPRLAIKAHILVPDDKDTEKRKKKFFEMLLSEMELVKDQLLERMAIQSTATVRNFSFLMGEGIWRGADKLKPTDTLEDVIKQGTLSIGFIGLAETLTALIGSHHGETDEAQQLGVEIIKFMRDYTDRMAEEYKLNFSLLATPAEGLSGRFVRIDREKYGNLKGITDKEYYTNSFHVPVGYEISAFDKIQKEAPYHKYTNAGHISYIELDGDPSKNPEAFMRIVRAEKEAGMGYAAINHPVDRDPVCGFNGIIDNVCPGCGRTEEDGVQFERIRRITGYLVGAMDRWNSAKAAEEADRVKHQI
ncbi:MAG: anaerobic ribonucleoside triphosphate reductase [Eubacteriaceae bacterium]|nr:anaerobic ribonucleoside triphosphate reductase [Eubacteriaceae bacterium]